MKFIIQILILFIFLGFAKLGNTQSSQELYNSILENTRLNPNKAIQDSKQLLALAKEHKSYDTIAIAYMYLGKAGRVAGNFKQALEYVDLGIEFAENNSISKSILAELYLTKANNLADSGRSDESAKVMFKGEEIAKTSGDIKAQVLLNHGLGYTYMASQKYDKAIAILKKNISTIEENKLLDKKSFEAYYKGMAMLARVYENKNEPDSTLVYLNKGLKHVLTTDDIFSTNAFYEGLSTLYLDKKEYKKAYEVLIKSKILDSKIGNEFTSKSSDYNLARYYYETNDYEKSIAQLDSIVSYYETNESIVNPEAYKLLAKSHKKLGNLEEANKYYELYVINYDNVSVANKKLSDLVQDKELEELKSDKERQKKIASYSLIAGGLVILFLISYVFFFSIKRKKEKVYFESLLSKINSSETQKRTSVIDTKDIILETTSTSEINEETTQEIINGLEKLEQQEYFLNQECNSYNVAKKIKTNTSYLSKVVNTYYQKNFNTYINDLRINYAVFRLKNDKQFRSYAIQAIANEVGYKSADSFTKYFKKHTGLNPSIYIKKLNEIT